MKKTARILIFVFLIAIPGLIFAEPGIKITQPLSGTIVKTGQEINVTIEPTEGFLVKNGSVVVYFNVSSFGKNPARHFFSLPQTYTFTVNNDAVGEVMILAHATSKTKKLAGDQIKIICQPEATLQGIKTNAEEISVSLDWNNNIESFYPKHIFLVEGVYSDGINRDIKNAGFPITYESSDSSVVSIDSKGEIQVYKAGKAHLIVSSCGFSANIPLVFEQPRGLRPSETIPPTTAIDIKPSANAAGWHNQDITITLTAKDDSGIQEVDWRFAGKAKEEYVKSDSAVVVYGIEGVKNFSYWSRDKEGNEDDNKVELRLDKTPPQLSLTSPIQDREYFHDETIPLTNTSTDALSGINSTVVSLDNTDITGQINIQPKVGSHALALTATDKADNKANLQANFIVKLKADIIIKPEVFLSDKGIFLALVRFPSGYDHKTITDAVCDGAPAKKIIKTKKFAIIVFRKQDITQEPIDTTFTVKGHFASNLIFEGTDTIKKVFHRQGKKDKEDEETEINNAVDELFGKDAEGKRIKKELGEIK